MQWIVQSESFHPERVGRIIFDGCCPEVEMLQTMIWSWEQ